MASNQGDAYPVQYSVDYPEGPRNRLTALFRIILVIPILIVISLWAAILRVVHWNSIRPSAPSLRVALYSWPRFL